MPCSRPLAAGVYVPPVGLAARQCPSTNSNRGLVEQKLGLLISKLESDHAELEIYNGDDWVEVYVACRESLEVVRNHRLSKSRYLQY